MAQILLISENNVRELAGIRANVAGKYLRPAIREAQDVYLRRITGDRLLAKLKELVSTGDIQQPANASYKALLDNAQTLLAYAAASDVAQRVTLKVGNAGVVKTPDDNVQVADRSDMDYKSEYYESKADSATLDLQNYIYNNRAAFPELTQGDCRRIKANHYSAASCGIFLGGARGKL